jgi:hypothetical protein
MTMDSPIEKKALFAQTRVQQALEAGAHYIDADDVRDVLGALVFCGRENKALLEKKTSAGRAYQNHIAWLEDQLAKARASTGGSRELVAASISIRDRGGLFPVCRGGVAAGAAGGGKRARPGAHQRARLAGK